MDDVVVLAGAVGADGVRLDVECRGGVITAVRRGGAPGSLPTHTRQGHVIDRVWIPWSDGSSVLSSLA